MKALTSLFNSLLPTRKKTRQGNTIIPSLPKAPPKAPPKAATKAAAKTPKASSSTTPSARVSSPKSNRATRGSTATRSVYSSRTPELTNKSPSPRKSASLQRLVEPPAKTATPVIPLKKNPINLLKMLNSDAINIILHKLALQHPQQIVLDKAFIKFYMTSANLRGAVNIDDIDRNLLSNLHTIYLDKLKIKPNIIRILEKTLKYSSITTIILSTIEFPSDANATAFFSFLQKNAPKLENLIIRASPKISNENIAKLISAIRELKKLVLLEFSGFDVRYAYKGTFKFDDMFINLLINLPDLEYLVFNNNIIGEEQYRRLFISTYAISAPKSETYLTDRYNMYIKSERMKFYDKNAGVLARTPSYFFDLIKFAYVDGKDGIDGKAGVQIYRDIFFFAIRNKTNGNNEGSANYLAAFDTNPLLNKYRESLLSKYPTKLAIPIMKRDTGREPLVLVSNAQEL